MNNLIKNELYKIFHKKFIYIMAILIVVLRIFVDVIINVSSEIDLSMLYAGAADELEKSDTDYTAEQISILVVEKNTYDAYQLVKENKFKSNSWQSYEILYGHVYEDITCMNNSKYLEKSDENYDACKEQYDKDLAYVKDGNWKQFIKNDLEAAKEEKEMLAYDEVSTEEEKKEQLGIIENKIKAYNYRLEYEVPYDSSYRSTVLNDYIFTYDTWQSVEHDEDKIIKYDDLLTKRETESRYEVTKYKVENNKISKAKGLTSSQEYVLSSFTYISSFVVILIVVLGATIISEEFSKGTIKQLLLKPFTRTQIIVSKYISCLIVFALFMLFLLVAYSVIDGLFFGMGDLFMPHIVYNFHTGKVMEINMFAYALLNVIGLLPHYLFLFTLAFLISVLLENGVVAIIIAFVFDTFVGIIEALMPRSLARLASFLPSSCWDLNTYLFGGLPTNQYSSFGKSLIVDIVLLVLMIALSISVFKKKDIKNQ